MRITAAPLLLVFVAACGRVPTTPPPPPGKAVSWPQYGNDPGGSRYSPLTDIDPGNVGSLRVAWTYHTGDVSRGDQTVDGARIRTKTGFEATPLVVDGVMYLPTPFNRVIALHAETGREKWTFDPHIARKGDYGDGFICRGVAYWQDPKDDTRRRIFLATLDARLISLDAASGKPDPDFGENGEVLLTKGIAIQEPGEYHITSPPAVVNGIVVVGSAINDNQRVDMESGVVRGYDARSGELKWVWDPIPREPQNPARATWEASGADRTGAANAWAPLSADPERGLVFVPTGSASPDFYGGERKGDNRHANSVVALHAATGQLAWAFQVVHHDLWDYDVPAQPTLFTFPGPRGPVPAVIQATKMGHLFVLHRETGKPLLPVQERPVPQGGVFGEKLSPTQPFPVATPPLSRSGLKPEDAWGLTPWDRSRCRDLIAQSRSEGIFTPPSLEGTIIFPGNIGGTNWGGLAVDPGRGLALVNQNNVPFLVRLIRQDAINAERQAHPGSEISRQRGTPYGMRREILLSPLGLPCVAPPWGTIAAVELATGKIRWQVPLGTTRDLSSVPIGFNWGVPNIGGPLATAGGLTFIGAALDNYLRAFETATGREVWKARLPFSAQSTPMTYRARDGGKQYVVICAGGHAKLGRNLGDAVIAYALP